MEIRETKSKLTYTINPTSRESGNTKLTCPVCAKDHSPGKQNNKDLSFNLETKLGKCHRCNSSFYVPSTKREVVKIHTKPVWKNNTVIDDKVMQYLESRKISQSTMRWNDLVSSGLELMNGKEEMTIQFNYWRKGELINKKFRDSKKHFKMVAGAELIFYNIDSIRGQDTVIITEGEMDCLSLLEAGYKAVVSVPNGAGASFEFMDSCIDDYAGVERIILATDQDEAGYKLREELARRLGIERCLKVDFDECKDANELLIKYGAERLRYVIEGAETFPLEGVFSSKDVKEELEQIYMNGLHGGETVGIAEFDKLLTWQTGRVYTVTGIPGHGKSEFIDFILTRLNVLRKWKIGYFSPENWPIELHVSKIIEKITGKKFDAEHLSRKDFEEASSYIADNYFFIFPEEDFTVESILAKASALVSRKGINVLVFDPYNRIEHRLPVGTSETHYISSFFDKLANFAKRKDVMIILVAHPTKMKKENGKYDVPNLYDISGSANFYNKTDFGISVYRDNIEQEVKVYVQKVKFKHLGEIGSCSWKYNINNGRYEPYHGIEPVWDNTSYFKRIPKSDLPQLRELEFDNNNPPF
jgi:twinkle protein